MLNGVEVAVLQGRVHLYEGYSIDKVTTRRNKTFVFFLGGGGRDALPFSQIFKNLC